MELRTVKLLLIPTKEQRQYFYDASYYSDCMYNEALNWNKALYQKEGRFYSKFDMSSKLSAFKTDNPEYKSISDYVLQSAISDLAEAFKNCFKYNRGFPKYKKIGSKLSFGVAPNSLRLYENEVQLAVIGKVKCKHCHYLTRGKTNEQLAVFRQIGKFHNPRVKFDGKYWILTVGIEVDIEPDDTTDEIIGIDLGVRKTITTSKGVVEPNINKTRKIINLDARKKRLQRRLSRKYELNKQGSKYKKTKNIKKLEGQVRLIDRKLHNIRENYNQTITNKVIAMHPKRIMIEDLKVRNLMKNRYLAKSIQDQQFYRIRQLLIEKALNTRATQIGVVNTYYPSSKLCNNCKTYNKYLGSSEIFKCSNCGRVIDRDLNASYNIRDCENYVLVAN